eukprot:TRINITY_DN1349_c0_g1_i2.p1 TRINITY_DN1349_c0_g1~~TRINITY_DN1349_c0_g1_i2.p1  ORF type:complete len:240 (+),score=56.71 TRINITY_DN1349_c0_g1_i2:70-789(+)
MRTVIVLGLLSIIASSAFASEALGSNVAAVMDGDVNGFTNKREALAPICSTGVAITCAGYGTYCFNYPATSSWSCCGCATRSTYGFQCGVCPYASQCYLDYTSPTYYRCSTSGSPSSLSPVGIAMICVGIFVFIVIVVVIAVIRRRRAYTTVEYTPGYGATVTTQPYPYYAPPPVIVEPAPVIVSDFGYHHHHHHGGYHHDAPAVGFSGGFSSGGDSAAVGFSGGFSSGGGNAAVGFSN